MEPIIINPKEILLIIEKKFEIRFENSILDFHYDPVSHLFGVRFFKAKNVISDSLDEEGLIILNKEEETDRIASLEILDLINFLNDYDYLRNNSISNEN
jgi:hypothetical protein